MEDEAAGVVVCAGSQAALCLTVCYFSQLANQPTSEHLPAKAGRRDISFCGLSVLPEAVPGRGHCLQHDVQLARVDLFRNDLELNQGALKGLLVGLTSAAWQAVPKTCAESYHQDVHV